MRIILLSLMALMIASCAGTNRQEPTVYVESEFNVDLVPTADAICQYLMSCADDKQSGKYADLLSQGNQSVKRLIIPKIRLYVMQENYSDTATESFARYIRSILLAQPQKE